jgi:tetratricopeptide (TPR) repeat protein
MNENRSPRTISRRRLWMMRLTAATIVPLVILGTFELVLRIAGYGYRTDYFQSTRVDGQDYLIPNPKFAYRFFPPALARSPIPQRTLAQKPANTFRIFLFGESAAFGDPDPAYGAGRFLEQLLELRYPEKNFEVVCVAMVAINSHAILPMVQECARLDGDLWILYMGNNEMIGAFGPGTVFSTQSPGRSTVRLILALKKIRIVQLLDALISSVRSGTLAPESWGGIGMFSKNQLRHDDPGRISAYANFKGNVTDILRVGREAGVPIILSTVASNLKDCSPFASLHGAGFGAKQLPAWEKFFAEGKASENAGAYQAALNSYAQAAALDPEYAELQYRLGICQLSLTNQQDASASLNRARDYDALAVRADSRINQILLDAASAYSPKAVVPLDAAKAMAGISPTGVPGRELFFEHVHYTLLGNYQLGRLFAETVAGLLPDSILTHASADWAEAEVCNRRLAATAWDQHRLWDGTIKRTDTEPFISQTSHRSHMQYCEARRLAVIAGMTLETPQQDRQIYEAALAASPGDALIRARFAQYLEATGSRSEAIAEFTRVCQLLPGMEWPEYHLGDLLARAGRFSEAADCFRRALAIRSEFAQARKELLRIQNRPDRIGIGN